MVLPLATRRMALVTAAGLGLLGILGSGPAGLDASPAPPPAARTLEEPAAGDVRQFGVKGDGTDESGALNSALSSGAKIVDGAGLTCRIQRSLVVPADVTLRNIQLVHGVPGMVGVYVSHRSRIVNTKLTGTGTTNIIERGIYVAEGGADDVVLDGVEVSNVTCGIQATALPAPKRWKLNVYVHDIVGQTGVSEGYGVLLAPADQCSGFIRAANVKRHALYLSVGAKHNDFTVDVDKCGNWAVQLGAYADSPDTSYNKIRGLIRNIYNPPGQTGQAGGVICWLKTNYNDISVTMEGSGTADYALMAEGGTSGRTDARPAGNVFHDCQITGQFTGEGIFRVQNAADTVVRDNVIRAHTAEGSPIILLLAEAQARISGGGYVEGNLIDAEGHGNVGIRDDVPHVVTSIGRNLIKNNGSALRVDAAKAGELRQGHSREASGERVVKAVPAGGSAEARVAFAEQLTPARVFLTAVHGGAEGPEATARVENLSSDGFSVRAFNPHAQPQNVRILWLAVGD